MGVFCGIIKSRDASKNRTADSAYSFFLGQSAAGKRVNERSGTYPFITQNISL